MNYHEKADLTPNGKKCGIAIFCLIVFLPALLSGVGNFIGKNFDVELNGYTDTVEKPQLTAELFFKGDYQSGFTAWFDANFKPRGALSKTYATIRYNLFRLSNVQVVGNNRDLFTDFYIESELCLSPQYDMSLEQNQVQMEQYVEKLELLQDKLGEVGKHLYVYTSTNKAHLCPDSIPKKYYAMSNASSISPDDYFRILIEKTSVPYFYTADVGRTMEYPAFYNTGIHWSRPFEQTVSQRILSDLCEITGKDYKKLEFGEVITSTQPFGRDADVFELLNVWNKTNNVYYEYSVIKSVPERFDKIGILLSGTSFAEGLREDILNAYPLENLYYVNYNNYLLEPNGTRQVFNQDWTKLDLAQYLDRIDVVVIEHMTPGLIYYSYGFVDYLLEVLETYTPQQNSSMLSTIQMLDVSSDEPLDKKFVGGFWGKETEHVWIKDVAEIQLYDTAIAESGLRFNFGVPAEIIEHSQNQAVHIFVNGEKVFSQIYNESLQENIVISPERLKLSEYGEGIFDITIMCTESFIPKELGMSSDSRKLALSMTYIGRA